MHPDSPQSKQLLQIQAARVAMFNKMCTQPEISEFLSSTSGGHSPSRKRMFQKLIVDPLNQAYPIPKWVYLTRSSDPEIPHPGMVFKDGHWRDPNKIEQSRAARNAKRRERDRQRREEMAANG
jgi:hypothetical protein